MASTPPSKAPTPVMRQYFDAKARYPESLLFFRMGDFYELFYDDAVTASRALDITLTSRNKGAEDEVPMAGVPHHSATPYIQKLIEAGFSVAMCEQMADPSLCKGVVPREVVRVITPGVLLDEATLEARQNNYLAAVERHGERLGVAALDVSTGELVATEVKDEEQALDELARLAPREVFVPAELSAFSEALSQQQRCLVRVRSESTDVRLPKEASALSGHPAALAAAKRCLAFAQACEPTRPLPTLRVDFVTADGALMLDEATQRHLELIKGNDGDPTTGLVSLLDRTKTSPGARLLRQRLLCPLTDPVAIRKRLDEVEFFVGQPALRQAFRDLLGRVGDLERLAVKLVMGRAGVRDLVALRSSLGVLPALVDLLHESSLGGDGSWSGATLDPACADACSALHVELSSRLSDEPPLKLSEGGVIRLGFDAELDSARSLTKDGQRLLLELEARLREIHQIPSLKLRYTRVFGWYIEVTKTHAGKAPASWRRKQTVATGERFTNDELDDLADKIVHAEDRASAREQSLYNDVLAFASSHADGLRAAGARVASWDVSSALAELAHSEDYCRPDVDDSNVLRVEDGRHPVVEKKVAGTRFVPNDVHLAAAGPGCPGSEAGRLWLITGPNMAGKSTFMRQAALIVLLAQIGSYVPAKRARVGVVDRLLTRVGASDNLSRGESTFMVEMKETAHVLRRATRRSFVLLDEIGRGTSTYDGLSIAWAVAEDLHDRVGCRTLFATHYHELTELSATRPGCENWSVSAREHGGKLVFLHRLQKGSAPRSYGVACARLAGVPDGVLKRAGELLEGFERQPRSREAPTLGKPPSLPPQLGLFGT